MQPLAIDAVGLRKSFDGTVVLDGVDFSLRRGSVHAVVGQNGAGKSTLMKLLNGFHPRDGGTVHVDGKPRQFRSTADAREAGIAMVYQDLSLIPSMTVAENIFLGRAGARRRSFYDTRAAAATAGEMLDAIGVGIDIAADQPVEELSPGQRQLVEIAKSLASDATTLILDEPTASLAHTEIRILFNVIRRLKARGIAIVYITHYLKDVFEICDEVTVLRGGRTVYRAATAKSDLRTVVREMLGKEPDQHLDWGRARLGAGPSSPPILEARRVSTDAVDNISLSVHAGEVVGLAGLLGSGRTEILKALFGLDPVRSGEILMDGRPIKLAGPQSAIEQGIYLVPEDRRGQGLVLDFSVEDNVLLSVLDSLSRGLLLDRQRGRVITEGFIERLRVKTAGSDQPVRTLSGGNQQKIVIAKCLSSQSKVLLLDDPTFGVDIHAKYEIMEIIRNYVRDGNAAIFVSSEYSEIAAFCDKTYIVSRRSIVDCVDNDGLTEDMLLQAIQ
jgi:ribose transport system ATP-binding protein